MLRFLRRNRKNLGLVGVGIAAVSGGLYLAQQYVAKKTLESQIYETRNRINQTRHRQQFEAVLRYDVVFFDIYIYIYKIRKCMK